MIPLMGGQKEELLQELGLSVNETKVYLALLQLGVSSAGKIADQCKLHRTNVYDSLERLEQKGLASHVLRDGANVFEASDPEVLRSLLDERRARLESVLPQFALDKQLGKKTTAHVCEGLQAHKLALFNFLKYKQPIIAYGIPKTVPDTLRNFIDLFHKQRIQKKITMRHLYNENAKERMQYLNSMKFTEAKYLPSEYNTPVSTLVCGPEVLLVHWGTEPLTFIRIENQMLADAYRNYFEILYAQGKAPGSPLS